MTMSEFLTLLNVVLAFPILIYVVRIEHRLTRLESLERRVNALESFVFNKG